MQIVTRIRALHSPQRFNVSWLTIIVITQAALRA